MAFRTPIPRLEVFSMWFTPNDKKYDDGNNYSNSRYNSGSGSDSDVELFAEDIDVLKDTYKIDEDPVDFKGRIFIADTYVLHEMYDSGKVGNIYTGALTKKTFKRKREDSISGYTDLQPTNVVLKSDHLQKSFKRKMEDSSSGEVIDLLSGSQSEEDFQESAAEIVESVSCDDQVLADLMLMGPNSGMLTFNGFQVIVHPDCGKPDLEKLYVDHAISRYVMGGGWIQTDYFDNFNISTCEKYDKSFIFTVVCASRLLNLECIVFSDAKAVHLVLQWLKQEDHANATDDDVKNNYMMICGRVTVSNNLSKEVSVVFETPLNKAVRVEHDGNPFVIPLLKSVVAVPYDSCFQVNAELYCFDNNANFCDAVLIPIVNSSATFPRISDSPKDYTVSPDFNDGRVPFASIFYKSIQHIDGIAGGQLQVTAFVDFQ